MLIRFCTRIEARSLPQRIGWERWPITLRRAQLSSAHWPWPRWVYAGSVGGSTAERSQGGRALETYMESTGSAWAKACSSFGGVGNRFSLFGISTPIQLRIWRIIKMRILTSPEPTLNRELSHALSEYLNECTFWRLPHGQVVPLFCHLWHHAKPLHYSKNIDMVGSGCNNCCFWRRCYT